jgi:hypothetical protein
MTRKRSYKNLVNQRFDKLLVLEEVEKPNTLKTKGHYWRCLCDCGNEIILITAKLVYEIVTSCGCSKKTQIAYNFEDISGQKFNKLTVIYRVKNNSNGCARWLCKCDCGNERVVATNNLISGSIKSCGCTRREFPSTKLKHLINKRFGRLVVVGKAGKDKSGNYLWECLCDCGNKISVTTSNLKGGNTQNCGCLRKEINNISKMETKLNSYIYKYKFHAKEHSLEFELTKEEFRNLISQNCFYCGREPEEKERRSIDVVFLANGIDRVNNKIGYKISNCVTCCTQCNKSKGTLTFDEFIAWIKKIHSYLVDSKIIL